MILKINSTTILYNIESIFKFAFYPVLRVHTLHLVACLFSLFFFFKCCLSRSQASHYIKCPTFWICLTVPYD